MPMIGGRNDHRIDILPIKQFAEILDRQDAVVPAILLLLGIFLLHRQPGMLEALLDHIANRHHLDLPVRQKTMEVP